MSDPEAQPVATTSHVHKSKESEINLLTYTPTQMELFFNRIKLAPFWRHHVISTDHVHRRPGTLTHPDSLVFLTALQAHMVTSVPFESLHLHYSADKKIAIDPESIFRKIVDPDHGRGGYCMENNGLFLTVLRTLGYDVYPTGARVNTAMQVTGIAGDKKEYMGWGHMVNIVTISSIPYLVDVGFGTNGMHHPYPLPFLSTPNFNPTPPPCSSSRHRITLQNIPQYSTGQLLYVFEFSIQPPSTSSAEINWIPAYSFSSVEFLPEDFAIMNWSTSTIPRGLFVSNVICVLPRLDESGHLVGDTSVFNDVVRYREVKGGKLEGSTKKMENESERLDVLKVLGVFLTEEEVKGISGLKTEIVG